MIQKELELMPKEEKKAETPKAKEETKKEDPKKADSDDEYEKQL